MKKAFTLAETLITLAIVGIIASITIPALVSQTNNKELELAFKRNYDQLYRATELIRMDHKMSMKNLCNDNVCLRDLYLSKMSGVKACINGVDGQCWHLGGEWYTKTGTPLTGSESSMGGIIFPNGAMAVFLNTSKDCTGTSEGVVDPIRCGRIRIDNNGLKGPNKMGYDIFDFHILEHRIVPRGFFTTTCGDWGCGADALEDTNYFKNLP